MRAIICTDSTGYVPEAVSAESMTASEPSKIALATSEASARVGRELAVIDSSICVAVMAKRPISLALARICFCAIGTASGGSSTPRSPRATITPSLTRRISSRLSMACAFSSLATTLISPPPRVRRISRSPSMSLRRRTNDAAM